MNIGKVTSLCKKGAFKKGGALTIANRVEDEWNC